MQPLTWKWMWVTVTYISQSSDFALSWRLFDGSASNIWKLSHFDVIFYLKIKVGHSDLYFIGQWFCHISWRQRWMNVKLFDYVSVWTNLWPQNKCWSQWHIFHHPVILPYILKTTWWMSIKLIGNVSVWHNLLPLTECTYRWQWPIFHSQVILLLLKTIWCMTIKPLNNESVWCRLLTSKEMQVTVTYISWSIEFAIFLEDDLVDEHQTFGRQPLCRVVKDANL